MKMTGLKRRFGLKRYQAILIGVVVAFVWISFATAMAASAEENGSKGWGKLDWIRLWNFGVLAIVLIFFLRKPFSRALSSRIKGIKEQLESLETQKVEAEKQLAQYSEKLSQLEGEAEKIVAEYVKQGNEARAKILKAAQATAEKLQAQARRNIEHEFDEAKHKLQQEIVAKSLDKALQRLKKEITDRDQDKLVDEYLKKVVA